MKHTPAIQIAIAEDHPIFRKGITQLIETDNKFKVIIEAENGRELLDKIVALPAPPDICLLDINMPVLNGYDTLVEIRKKWTEMKVLILFMYETDLLKGITAKNGANGYIPKNCEPKELINALHQLHTNGYYLEPGQEKTSLQQILSANEFSFLSFCATELPYQQIANKMFLSIHTIDGYRKSVCEKLYVHTREGLAVYAIQSGIIPSEFIFEGGG